MCQATFSLSAKSEERQLEEGPTGDMVHTILFILTNLQHSMADYMILSRTAVVKRNGHCINTGTVVFRGSCIMGLNISGYTLFFGGRTDRHRACILVKNVNTWDATRILL